MELQSHVTAKKLWNYLRLAFLMMRKTFASKRKLLMDMNLVERGKLLGIKSLSLIFHHPSHRGMPPPPAFGGRHLFEYEFSCSNTPSPVFYHAAKRRHAIFFPCLHAVAEEAPDVLPAVALPPPPPRIAFSPGGRCSSQLLEALGPGERRTPTSSPFSVRVSDFSSEDADECGVGGRALSQRVDDEAEEFIRGFYEQLRAQIRIALPQYQEKEHQEMLARRTNILV